MANRISVAAFIVFACLLLAPLVAQARSGGGGGAGFAAGGGFRGGTAGHVRAGAARVHHGHGAARFGKPGFGKPGFAKHGFVGHGFGKHGFGKHGFTRHGFGKHGFHGRRLAYRYGYGGYGAYLDDTFVGAAPYAVPYPVAVAPAEGQPEVTGGIGGPLVLRHICQSEVQVVPATRGGEHEVTMTRCRLYAE